ncbi:MAG TPA: InlB B-repeat-containing protein, partial [Clostridia bacterium]|nr:InlB B-repeat-containing protein [Clostridia bacterium]
YQYLGMALNRSTPFPESYYTDATYASYRDAMNAGSQLYNNQNLDVLDQPIINDATALINATFEALVLKDVTYTVRYESVGGSPLATDVVKNATAGDTVTEVAMAITGYTPVQASQQIDLTGTNAENIITFTYNIDEYTVSFDANGGTTVAAITQDYATDINEPTAPTREGYLFDAWYMEEELTNPVTWPYTLGASDVTFYAKWTANTYTIIYDGSGATDGSTAGSSHTYGIQSNLSSNGFTKTGHTFTGWSILSGGTADYTDGQGVLNLTPTLNDVITFYAVWVVNEYEITFDANGGSAVDSITQDYATAITAPADPTRAGYTFDGWDPAVPATMPAEDTECVAQWTINAYTLSFDSDGGTAVAAITQDYATAITAPADPTKQGHTFAGWLPEVPAFMPAENTEYTAKWIVNTYTITWDADGGTGGGTDNVDHGTVPTPIDAGTKTGYTFTSWSPSIVAATGAATYTAQWSVNSYDLTFDANNGTGGTGPTSTQYGTALTPPTVTREGYTFTGWDPELAATMPAADTTYTAQWSIDAFTISFDSAGGSAVADISQDYGTAVTQPADPTREGYTFDGWSPAVPTVMPAENFECVAQWTLNTYTITWDANGGTGGGTNSCDHGDTPTPVSAGTKVGYTFTGWDPTIVAATEAATYTAQWSASAVNITFDANGGTGGTGATSMQPGTALTAPTVTKDGYVFGGWLPTVPATVPETDMTYVAQWVQTAVNVTKTEDGMVVNIQGWTADSQYQIWTYQQVQSDDLLAGDAAVQANQWILSKAYTPGSAGDVQGDGSINFTIFEEFISPTENYLIAVRIADANNNFVAEIRDAYTPEDVGEVVITKIIVDNVVTTGYELREIKGGAEMFIEVIGNNVPSITYTATILSGATPMPLAMVGNELTWNISALDPGIYTVEFTATNGNTTATQLMTFELFATVAPGTGYGIINSMLLAPTGTGVNITPDFANGTFSFRLREPGRTPQFRSIEYAVPETVAHPITAPGIYHVYGYVTRAGLIGTEVGGIDDGMIRTLVIPRTGQGSGPVTMSFTANQALPDVPKHTPIVFTAQATGLPDTVEYSFWRYDATGYILIKDWSSDNTLNWTPARIGEYSLEARAKGVGAGSYEINRSLTVNITDADEAKADITNITLNTAQLTAAQARQPIMLKANATSLNGEDLLYKFYVYDEDMRNTQLKGYSVDQHCVWTPRKAGMTYTISVLVKNQTSFGKYDAIESFEVTVN